MAGQCKNGILVVVPTLGSLDTEFVGNLLVMLYPIHTNHMFGLIESMPVAEARNKAVEAALEEDCKYIYFRDNDVLAPPDALPVLMTRNVPVVGGLYYSKYKPPAPLLFVDEAPCSNWKQGDLVKCEGLGMGCTLIEMDVFKKMSPPWFQTGQTVLEHPKMPMTEDHTEDSFFFKRLREELGIYPYVDTAVLCIHKDVTTKERFFFDPATNLPSWIAVDGSTQTVLPADHPLATVVDLTKREGVTE